jgi:predicted alpha-1,2-mannosidase
MLAALPLLAPNLARPALAATASDTRDLTAYVNPLAGTLGPGFPMVAAHVPFGMIEPGPDTGMPGTENPVNYCGYSYVDTMIRGFGLSHFDGAGIHIGGDIPFMATTGSVSSSDPGRYGSAFSHAQETAQPGYYAVNLLTYNTAVAITATQRAAIERFTFPSTAQANIIANPGVSIGNTRDAAVTAVGDRTLEGWTRSDSAPDGYVLYFTATFDRPFTTTGTWTGSSITPGSRTATGSGAGGYVSFDTTSNPTVTMRVGISYVDLAGARNNLQKEIPASRSFDAVHRAAHDSWNAHLHGIEVDGGAADLTQTFYSNLYRAMGQPALFDDADGRYLGFDRPSRTAPYAIHRVRPGEHHYTKLSLWDTYRTQNPLMELIEPRIQHDVLVSMLDDYDQNHQAIPKWTDANLDYQIMGGDGGSAEVADGVARGILKGPEARRAYAALAHQALTINPPVGAREHLDEDVKLGYIAYGTAGGRSTAETQEYAIVDAAVLQLAQRYGTPAEVAALREHSDHWKNLMDPSGFIRPRNADGSWANPTSTSDLSQGVLPGVATVPWRPEFQDGYQEATGWQQTWLVSHDVAGLTKVMGGVAPTLSKLDKFFSSDLADAPFAVPVTQQYTSFFGVYYIGNQFTPANEVDLQSPWFYDYLGQPSKTQKVVRAAMETYSARPDGLPGNDDTGTMSSWYVLAALGIYATTPGVPAFELNSPSFPITRVHLGGGRTFTETALGSSMVNKYIQAATLRGRNLDHPYITQCDLAGGTLDYQLGATAGGWATTAAAPPSVSDATPNALVSACSRQILR